MDEQAEVRPTPTSNKCGLTKRWHRCLTTLKEIDAGFSCHLSSDGRYAAFPHIAFSTLLRKNLEPFMSSLPLSFPEYSDLVPYNAPIRGDCSPVAHDKPSGVHAAKKAKAHPIVSEMSNEEAYEWQKARWAAMRALFPQPDSELFRGVTNLVVLDLAKCTPTKSRKTVGQFLLAKARKRIRRGSRRSLIPYPTTIARSNSGPLRSRPRLKRTSARPSAG